MAGGQRPTTGPGCDARPPRRRGGRGRAGYQKNPTRISVSVTSTADWIR